MKNSILNKNKSASWMNFLVVCLFFIGFNAMAQGPGCPNIDAGDDVEIGCDDDCAQLTATYLQTGQTTNYTVTGISPNSPFPTTGGTSVSVNIDDRWSDAINLPFDFCFYGQNYSQMLVGSNGVVTFDLNSNTPDGFCEYSFSDTLPNSNLFLATIFGPYMDIDPSVQGSGTINWRVLGTAPCRTMVVSYPSIPYFRCNELSMTTQIVLYETTNVVEVYLDGRSDDCDNWNDGNAVLGIQNQNGTAAVVAPGRNTGNWASNGEAWRFTPSGAPNVDITWYDGNGNVVGNEPTITVCPDEPGETYRVVANYTDCDGNVISVNDAVNVTVLVGDSVAFHYENEDHINQTEFCIGEDVYLNGEATLDTANYFMDLWIVNSGGGYNWISGAGWMSGTPDFVNITDLFENDPENPVTFQVGVTYAVKLAINDPDCGWVELLMPFTIIDCCDDFDNANFSLGVDLDYNFWVGSYESYDDLDAVHEWYVVSSSNQGAGPYTPEFSTTTTGGATFPLFTGGQFGVYYTVVHKVITYCGEICYAQEQFQEEGKKPEEYSNVLAVEVDCCFVFDFWPNGPGEPSEFTAEFQIGLDLNGNILTQVANEYANNPSTMHEWYLLSSPNPTGGPYDIVDYGTGVDYTYGPIDDEIYYFLIHRVKTDCGEVCYGQSICRNCKTEKSACEFCGTFDCSLLDEVLPDCEELAAPTNLQVMGDTLTWDAVPGALSYIVSSPGGTDPQISCNCHGQISIVPLDTDTNSVVLPRGLQSQCFVWMVTAVCYDGTRSNPSSQECYFPIRGTSKESSFENAKIAPNPNNGNMTFVVETTYDTDVTIEVYDFYGKLIQSFVERLTAHSEGTIEWNATGKLARGIYIVSFKTDKETLYKKIIVD
ncbi:MAG: T9SS type A sorting domain-containing protein [Flavobacteriaceae bacterium]|nr:T9SS type A sorting domain-containing protein [Flavobacteriaceae bacterium]